MMKNVLLCKRYCLLLAMLLAMAMPAWAGYVWECPVEWNGDVNRDGDVNIADVSDLIDALLNYDFDSVDGDVNVNGVVNIADVVDLIDMLLYEPDDLDPVPGFDFIYNMVYVRSDTYMMGATDEQAPYATASEYEAHQVKQYPFYIGQTEVTQEFWQAVMGGNPSKVKGRMLPVTDVTWEDCQEFILRLNRFTGRRYRLPTEAEWELAARGGRNRHSYVYAGSNTLASVGWYDSNSTGRAHIVADLSPNELKIYDMSGNVWEWCQDYWSDSYAPDYVLNPLGPETGSARLLRGGSWMNIAANCRVSSRNSQPQDASGPTMGFRLAMDAPYSSWFMLSDKIVYLKVDEKRSVDILNGSGSYTIYNGDNQIVDCRIDHESLMLRGLKVGTTSVIVKDNLTGDKTHLTVIVYKPVRWNPDHVDGVSFNMIYVEGGIFKMGATTEQGSDAYSNESPAHHVTLANYAIGETEVTQALWNAVMGSNPSGFKGDMNRPVERVSWVDCMEFLDRLNELTGHDYRLPSEAEWEYAARGGIFSQGFKFAGGNVIDDVAWYSGNSDRTTHPVAGKLPNELGIYDMTGNVMEWCQDWYGVYTTGHGVNPTGYASGSTHVTRGGNWSYGARMNRVSYRSYSAPTTSSTGLGLRLAMDMPGNHRFGLSRYLVRMEVGEQRVLNIFNGSGDYTLTYDNGIVDCKTTVETLSLTGLSEGSTVVVVKDNDTGAQALVTVIVTQRRPAVQIPVLNDTIWMEYVKGGTFNMGATPEQQPLQNDHNEVVHQVSLSSYYICNREVTQHLWYAVMGHNPSRFTPASGFSDDLYKPVEQVSWYDCQRFIARLNMMTGLNFRMPTEAEWEFAARGGTHSGGYRFAGSNSMDEVGWYLGNSGNQTHHGMLKAPNELNLYDMSGNVGEWCLDWFDGYSANPQSNPVGPYSGSKRVWRSGCWASDYSCCQVSFRGIRAPSERQDFLGLRLAMDAQDMDNRPGGPGGDGGDVKPRFRVSRSVVTLEVGEQVNLSILHGSGNYSVINSEQYVLADVDGDTLMLTGKAVGIEDVIVKDNDKNAYTLVTAIVVEPTPPSNVVLDDSVKFDMIYIPAGAFVMGHDGLPGASPAHYVSLNSYYIGSTEVTNLMWRWAMDYPINWKAADLHKPVEGLSWEDCQEFIARLNEKTGRQYRLPTEAEWEYAAMGANRSRGYDYAGSNSTSAVAWYWDNMPSQQIGTDGYGAQRVAAKQANEKGIYDMSGNVREWCQDWYGAYPMSIQYNPTGSETGTDRVLRGGCYLDSQQPCRVKARSASRQSGANYVGTGLRLAMDAVTDTVNPGPTPDYHYRMSLSERVIKIPVGGQRTVRIFNGSGSYTLYNNNPAIAGCLINGESLALTGLTVGTTDVRVVDNITMATAWLTVIVYRPDSGGVVPGPDELFNEPNMIYVQGGTFVRGATSEQGSSTADELPLHQITVSNYYISQTEVTQRLWERVMGGNPSHFKGEKLPVEQVSWEDCQEFIRRLNQMTGRNYRMVTEAEWEYAARGGRLSMGYKYAGANTVSNQGWYKGNSGSTTHEVAKKNANELGIYDMSGNVWEWCQDVYGPYGADNLFNPVGPDPEFTGGTVNRVMRGGAWDGALSDCRVARRLSGAQDYMATNVGLRLAMDAAAGAPLSVDPRVLYLNVGEQATVDIKHGTGDYTATGGGSIASFQLSGSVLTVTGQQVGTTTINIKDNTTLARTVLTVIVRQPREKHEYKTITFWIRYISGGAFDMGATSEQGSTAAADESPVHRTLVPSFGIGETEVTQELWQAVMGYNPSVNTGNVQQPVDNVTWEEAEQFVARLSDLLDKPYRLPTEAEWEYAARGGRYGSSYRYAGSNTVGSVAWYSLNSGGTTHPVATKAHNSEWLYDMSGNVDEWCQDWYGLYSAEPVFDPVGPDSAQYHVARGGRWDTPSTTCRVSARSAGGFGETLPGVRIALERPYSYWFGLSRSIVWLKVGGSRTVDIYNGSGSYTIYSSKPGVASYVVDGEQISLTGLKEGRTVLQVMDNVSHEHKTLTVIVRNPVVPLPDDDPDDEVDPTPGLDGMLKMIYVPGGTFAMGATSEQGSDAASDENPSHLVTLSSFYVSETEVTQALWKRVMGSNPSHFKGDRLPVEQVTWEDCQEFINRLNDMTGRQYRLLTEAEWEFAARGAGKSKNYKYAGSNTIGNVAWYTVNSGSTSHNVKLKTKNELGIYDMSGNVAEWCQDVYGAYDADNQRNPVGPNPDGAVSTRVVRGGAWDGDAAACRVASRASRSQDYCDSRIGLRLARDASSSGSDGLMVVTHRVVELEVGEQTTVGIVNGSGNYVAAGGGGIVSYSLSGSTLTLTGLQVGTSTVNVKDNTSGVWTIITVIVNESEVPYKYRNITFWIRFINGGSFDQGATDEQAGSASADESPVHRSMVPEFGIGKYEVTQELWQAVMGYNNSVNKGNLQLPVDNITWDEAQQFVARLSDIFEMPFRLPTEAEWEYAARGARGSKGYKFAGGNSASSVAWYVGNSGGTTHAVGTKRANERKLYDMSGNVDEWCQDWYGPYSDQPAFSPLGPVTGSQHVVRGGRWTSSATDCRVSARSAGGFGQTLPGLRVALECPYSYCLALSRQTLWMEVGDNRSVSVINGSGSYTVSSSVNGVVSYVINGDKLSVSALKAGHTTITVLDNVAQEAKTISVTVVEPAGTSEPEDVDGAAFEMIYVRGGTFKMGGTDEQGTDAYAREKPVHLVTLNDFKISNIEVTQQLWLNVMGSNPSTFTGNLQLPVDNVSWEDCQLFIAKLNEKTGKHYRLPTEAEWEYAARGGARSLGYKYAGSNTIGNVAWYSGNASSKTHVVGSKQAPNELGIHDMSGNVMEWCQDWYGAYAEDSQVNPHGPASGSQRIMRGGSWNSAARSCRVSYRIYYTPTATGNQYGLRLAEDVDNPLRFGLSTTMLTMEPGDQQTVNILNGSGDYTLDAGSSVVTCVLSGEVLTVTANAVGATTVSVTDNATGENVILTVLVTQPVAPFGLSQSELTMEVGNTATIDILNGRGNYTVRASTSGIVTPAISGEALTVKALKAGTTTLTVTDVLTGSTAALSVTVTAPALPLQLSQDNLTMVVGMSATVGIINGKGSYAVAGGTGIVSTVISGNTLSLQALAPGTATITVTDNVTALTASLTVTVTQAQRGDVNCDGTIDELDYGELFAIYGGQTPKSTYTADVNADGTINFKYDMGGDNGALIEILYNGLMKSWNGYPFNDLNAVTSDGYLKYDINRDGEINIADFTAIVYGINDGIQEPYLDLDGDGTPDWRDACIFHVAFMRLNNLWPEEGPEEESFTVGGVTFKMITVDGGTFSMGDDESTFSWNGQSPEHQVTLSDYKIGQTQVTQELWETVMGYNPSLFKGNMTCPMERASWVDCQRFILRLNQLTGKKFRMLTEAEWEFAARGGTKSQGYKFSGSNNIEDVAWYMSNASSTHPVATKAPNELGIYDMTGNVAEWCQDWFGKYSSAAQTDPIGPVEGTSRIHRDWGICGFGGQGLKSYDHEDEYYLGGWYVTWRSYDSQDYTGPDDENDYLYMPLTGLRLALDFDNSPKFRLAETVVMIEVGESKTVSILNGCGDYYINGGSGLVTAAAGESTLTLNGTSPGTTSVVLTDIASGAQAAVNVIVTKDAAGAEETYTVGDVTFKMITVTGGSFTMGASEGDTESVSWMEKPAHQVSLSTFKMAQTEVTQALWQVVMNNNPSHFTGSLQRPVESVSWIEAHEFIYRLNHLTGKKFRLATDAEWEFAARGGTKSRGYKYAGSNSVGTVAWYSGNSSNTTHDVATKQANELGIYDMSGNVAEWTQDMYYEYTDAAQINPNMGNSFLNVRNGSYGWDAKSCRLPYRTTYDGLIEGNVYDHVGLRIALDEDNSTKFRLSETVIEVLEGEQRLVDILNGSGNYSVVNSELYSYFTGEASYHLNGNQLIVNGLSKGLSRVVVTNQSNGATAVLTVIVNELPKEQFTVGGVTFSMVSVNGGTFTMGNSSYTNASPTHEVELSDFMMGQTEVTQALWKAVMGSNPSIFTGDLQRPVEQVSWNDCQEFILKLNQLTGRKFRFPTEAEWEFAARGGLRSRGYNYIGSNNLSDVAWFSSNAGKSTHEVAAKAFNESGFYDMGGNVNEWCQDWYGDYTSSLQMNPTGPASATLRVNRGGCYSDYEYSGYFYVASRRYKAPTEADKTIGLRLALDPDNSTKFRMAEPVVTVEVGKSISVSFLNGNGSYSVAGSTANFTRSIVSGKLKVTGTAVGTNTVTVTNTSTGATAVLTVIVTEAPTEITEKPSITYELSEDLCVITATGKGEVRLYVNNEQVANPYTLVRSDQDYSVIVTATAQEEGKQISETAQMEILIPSFEPPAPPFNEETFTVNGVTFKMITVEGGTFTMGVNSSATSPEHQVTLSHYMIGQTEVTQALWQAVMGSNPSAFTGNLKYPVENVSWNSCQAFIYKLNELTGKRFRLVTEAEWEYAARGGKKTNGYSYSGSNTIGDVAWYVSNSNNTTHVVATKSPNELGLYDMSGNVMEWCQDWYGSYSSNVQTDPVGPESGTKRVLRGGDMHHSASFCHVKSRQYYVSAIPAFRFGLRLALDFDNSTKFRLAEPVVKIAVGESKTVDILNANGLCGLYNTSSNFTSNINGHQLTVTGVEVGTNTIIVFDHAVPAEGHYASGVSSHAVLTVIVTEASQT